MLSAISLAGFSQGGCLAQELAARESAGLSAGLIGSDDGDPQLGAAVRRCVLEFKAFRSDAVNEMALAAGIPEADRADVVAYVREQIAGLHEGNVIRYRLKPGDLDGARLR